MANKVRIYSTLKSGKVSFDGARVNSKNIGSLSVEAHPTLSNRIRIKSLTQFKRNSDVNYRVFFGKLNIDRIQNEAGVDLVATLGMDRTAVIAYVQQQITRPIVTEYFEYNPVTDRLEANKNIEVKKHGFFIGGKYKMASGNSNLYYEDLSDNSNSYPVMGEVFDQSLAENQVAGAGTSNPKMRVFGDYQVIPLGGTPVENTAIGYDGDNFFPFNISGVGITVKIGEAVTAEQQLKYEIIVGGISVYIQYLPKQVLSINQDLTWYFDHPLDIEAGTTLKATVYKVSTVNNQEVNDGVLQVCQGSSTPVRYATSVLNRFFEDKDLEQISPYTKYQAMDFSIDATGSHVIMKDLTLAAGAQVLRHYPINGLEAVATGTTIQVKIKDGSKIILTSVPVGGVSVAGSLVNAVLNQAVIQLNSLFSNSVGFAANAGNPVVSFALVGNNLTIGLEDTTSFTVDVTTLGVDTDSFVSSGALVGSNLVLTMDDGSTVTIDATNMINGATLSAVNDEWFISYGANANIAVGQSTSNNTLIGGVAIHSQGPYYYGQALTRGSEFKFNFQHSGGYNFMFGIWDGPQEATQYGSSSTVLGQLATSNWSTGFRYQGGFLASNNTSLTNSNSGGKYVLSNGTPLVLRFALDGHLSLFDASGATEVEILTTQAALPVSSFNVQMGVWQHGQFFNTIISESGWEIVHDFDSSENGIFDGIKDHTVLRSLVTIVAGQKFMFDLDRLASNESFGTLYSGASSGSTTAETLLSNSFTYRTNEAITPSTAWTVNTAATRYFLAGGGLPSWRVGGSNNTQGIFSIRYQLNNTIEIWSETENELVATAVSAADGNALGFYMGSETNMTYDKIPTVTKQSITQGTQPNAQFAPTVADQTVTVIEGEVLNFTVVDSDNVVNQYVEVDAPSWMTMNQVTGVLTGTAVAFAGTAADTIVVSCKAGNAIGGTVDFTVTVTIASYASTNTKSLDFSGTSASLQGPHANVTALQRANTNGTGAADAWTISMWVKPSTASNTQTLFYYGGDDIVNEGRIEITQFGGSNILFRYGSNNNNVTIFGVNSFPVGQWNHVMVSYDGAATTNTSADISQYVSARFTVNVNGSQGWNSFQHVNYGYTGSIIADKFRVGRLIGATTSQYMLGGRINQIGIWGTDERANLATIYNGGATQDLSLLSSAPEHYYEIENSITTITDIIGNADLTAYNFVAADLVTDTP